MNKVIYAYNTPRVSAFVDHNEVYEMLDFRPFAYLIRYFYAGSGCSHDVIIDEFKHPSP